jgi:1-acyl-sn-glycerol-3-phosphate acyltransferase
MSAVPPRGNLPPVVTVPLSVCFWLFVTATSAALFPVAAALRLATAPFDARLAMLHRFTSWWASLYTWCNPLWRVEVSGGQHLPAAGAFVIVANHQSLADIFVFFRLRTHYKWVSKVENFRIPFIGWNMTLNRYIAIRRGSVKSHLRMMRECEEALRGGSAILMFPEGTRSPDGRMRTFKDGAFELALRTGVPVVPVAVTGTAEALPKSGALLRGPCVIRLQVLPPILPASGQSAHDLARQAETVVREALGQV